MKRPARGAQTSRLGFVGLEGDALSPRLDLAVAVAVAITAAAGWSAAP